RLLDRAREIMSGNRSGGLRAGQGGLMLSAAPPPSTGATGEAGGTAAVAASVVVVESASSDSDTPTSCGSSAPGDSAPASPLPETLAAVADPVWKKAEEVSLLNL
ncbi:hypothetical protein HK405_001339, partial [Cladochytrium tenue]